MAKDRKPTFRDLVREGIALLAGEMGLEKQVQLYARDKGVHFYGPEQFRSDIRTLGIHAGEVELYGRNTAQVLESITNAHGIDPKAYDPQVWRRPRQ